MFATNTLLIKEFEFVPRISLDHSLKLALRESTRLNYFIIMQMHINLLFIRKDETCTVVLGQLTALCITKMNCLERCDCFNGVCYEKVKKWIRCIY